MRVTFFRPAEVSREHWTMPLPLYRDCRTLLRGSDTGSAFVPVRGMQVQAVIDEEEVLFVDSQGYAVQDGAGGRLILLAWWPVPPAELASVSKPVPCQVVYYRAGLEGMQSRLVGEFGKALRQQAEKSVTPVAACGAKVLGFRRSTT